jgi:hypothetical protein
MFRTDLLSIIRSLIIVFTEIGICRTSYVECLLATKNITEEYFLVTVSVILDSYKLKHFFFSNPAENFSLGTRDFELV